MTRRVVIGPRSNGDVGVFVSPSGVDAYTAADSNLVLGISSRVSQLLVLGRVSSSARVTLGFGAVPHVLLTSQQSLNLGYISITGPMRPSPMFSLTDDGHGGFTVNPASPSYADIASDGAYMDITAPSPTIYAVYNRVMA
jgi:hypothetical protein